MKSLFILLMASTLAGVPDPAARAQKVRPAAKERTLSPLRVMNTDPGARFVTVIDGAGVTQVLAVRGDAVRDLGRLRPGDTVVLSLGPEPGVPASGDVVLRIQKVDPEVAAPPNL